MCDVGKRTALLAEDAAAAEDRDEYLAENMFWVPKEARWSHLQVNAKQPSIRKLIDEAIPAIEVANPGLKGILPKDYNRALDKVMLGEPIDLVCGSAMGKQGDKAKDILGRVYKYFLLHMCGMERLSNGALPVQAMVLLLRMRCPCVLPVQFRRSAGAFTRARSGEG